jgi:hypothetical protein
VDDSIIDENAPLSFQFRPELRQVQVAVELLNANPNPPVRPILRDPPSVKEAKAKAKAEDEAAAKTSAADGKDGDVKIEEAKAEVVGEKAEEGRKKAKVVGEKAEVVGEKAEEGGKKAEEGGKKAELVGEKAEVVGERAEEGGKNAEVVGENAEVVGEKAEEGKAEEGSKSADDDDEEELNVENFNGIPVFQAKGLTFLQNNQQLVPLFCSKWDLEAAWDQLVATPGAGVSGKCDVEVGTLEDVLRRMSESKTGEFENVIFVPSREAMKAIGQPFPLDDFSPRSKQVAKPVVKKASFSRAKEIKARGGTQAEIRAAIEEDLAVFRERQRMAEMVASITQAVPAQAQQSAGDFGGRVPQPRRPAASQKPVSGHERREALRKRRDAAGAASSGKAGDAPGLRVSQTTAPSPLKKVDTGSSKEVVADA